MYADADFKDFEGHRGSMRVIVRKKAPYRAAMSGGSSPFAASVARASNGSRK